MAVRMRRMLRSALLKSLLIVALLFVQQGAIMHSISHVLTEQTQDQSLPHDKYCKLCAVYAQMGSAINVSHIDFDFSSVFEAASTSYRATFRSIAFTAFAARAPPRSA
jgi:hypothetical protein